MKDLLLLWEWPWDAPFVQRVLCAASAAGVAASAAGPEETLACLERLSAGGPAPLVIIDRASDVLPSAARLVADAKARGVLVVNDPDRAAAAVDKARMHLALMSIGVEVPWTLLLPPDRVLTPQDEEALTSVGTPFVIKPAHGGGGDGVVLGASTLADIARARLACADDTVLVQEHIVPRDFGGRPAYFRVLYCLGDIHPCFWHPDTSEYAALSEAERASDWARGLEAVARAIAGVSLMSLFSTEVALSVDGRWVAVDYVNDMCDLRPASLCAGGVPDPVLDAIVRRLVAAAGAGSPGTPAEA